MTTRRGTRFTAFAAGNWLPAPERLGRLPAATEGPERNPDCDAPHANADRDCLHSCGASRPRPAHADSVSVFSGSIGGTSDFVFRGLSLTRGKPAAQASIDVEFPREFYVGAFVATADPNPGPSPTGGNGRLGRPLLAPVGKFFGRPAAVAVHLSRRSAARELQPHRAHRARWAFATSCSSRLSTRPTPRPSARRPATKKATPGRWSCPAASRSTSASRSRPASATTASKRSTTTATTTGTSR